MYYSPHTTIGILKWPHFCICWFSLLSVWLHCLVPYTQFPLILSKPTCSKLGSKWLKHTIRWRQLESQAIADLPADFTVVIERTSRDRIPMVLRWRMERQRPTDTIDRWVLYQGWGWVVHRLLISKNALLNMFLKACNKLKTNKYQHCQYSALLPLKLKIMF